MSDLETIRALLAEAAGANDNAGATPEPSPPTIIVQGNLTINLGPACPASLKKSPHAALLPPPMPQETPAKVPLNRQALTHPARIRAILAQIPPIRRPS